jgi:hypothetical protein
MTNDDDASSVDRGVDSEILRPPLLPYDFGD